MTIVDNYVLFVIADLRVANIYLEKALIKQKILVATAFTDPGIELPCSSLGVRNCHNQSQRSQNFI